MQRLRSKLPRRWQRSQVWERPSHLSQQQIAFDQKLVWQQRKQRKLPSLRQLKYVSSFFSARERFVVGIALFSIVFALGLGGFLGYAQYVEPVPTQGGSYAEALVGSPLYINPILATTNDVDLDISQLVFAGLLRHGKDLQLEPNLAEYWEVNEEKTVYTIRLQEGLTWHDGEPLTVDDVVFTYRAIQEPAVNSPLQLSLQDVTIERVDDRTIRFTLKSPFTPFASLLTTGIIPQHLWAGIPASTIRLAELNVKPIGSGPWKFSKLEKDKLGNLHSYTLVPFEQYHGEKPYLEELTLRFYPDFGSAIEALNSQRVEGISFLPRQLVGNVTNMQNYQTHHLQLPQYTAIFFNERKNEVLKEKNVRKAFAYALDRSRMVKDVLGGVGTVVNGPLLEGMVGYDPAFVGYGYNPVQAQSLLEEAGWTTITAEEYAALRPEPAADELVHPETQAVYRKKDDKILEITLATVDQPETVRAAEFIRDAWTTIGVKVNLLIVPVSVFRNETIRTKDYDALLYSHILNVYPDYYSFWHSTQIEYPGLNFTSFADGDVDETLEKSRTATTVDEQVQNLRAFQQVLGNELPAIFLYSAKYTYLLPNKINDFDIDRISIPADRWNNLSDWYVKTKRVVQPIQD